MVVAGYVFSLWEKKNQLLLINPNQDDTGIVCVVTVAVGNIVVVVVVAVVDILVITLVIVVVDCSY